MIRLAPAMLCACSISVADPQPCTPLRVLDGDTLVCEGVGHVRATGYDTPEIRAHCDRERIAADRATAALSRLIWRGQAVTVDISGLDRYGRTLGRVLVDGKDVAGPMLASGYARPYGGGHRAGWCK